MSSVKKRKVLVVDDQADLVDLIKTILTQSGYEVLTARNGEEAFQIVKRIKPDLVILDLKMPTMGGLSFYQCISATPSGSPDFPVLVVTGASQELDGHGGFDFDGLLAKPFDVDELLGEVERLLGDKEGPVDSSPDESRLAG